MIPWRPPRTLSQQNKSQKPPCSARQKTLRNIGSDLSTAGTYATVGSLAAGGLSAIGGVAGIVTADPELAYFGGRGVELSAQGFEVGTALSLAGEAVSLLGNDGGPVDRQAINAAVSLALSRAGSNEYVNSVVELALDKAEEAAGVGEGDTGCTP